MKDFKIRLSPFRISIHLIILSICLFMQIFMVIDGSLDYDVLWHIKQGEVYINNGITTQDYLSWQQGLTWTTAEWLYEVLIYLVQKYLGVIGFVLILALNIYQIYGWAAVRNKLNHPIMFMGIFAITFLFPKNIYNRPGEFQIILTMVLLNSILKNDKWLIVESALFGIFLANFHGGQMVTALAIMIIQLVCVGIHYIMGEDRQEDKEKAIKLSIQTIVMFLTSLINPMGLDMYIVGMKVPGMYSTQFIDEWTVWNIDYIQGIFILLAIIQIAHSKEFKSYSLKQIQILAITSAFTILQIKTQRIAGYLAAILVLFCYDYIVELYDDVVKHLKCLRVQQLKRKVLKVQQYLQEDQGGQKSESDTAFWRQYKESLQENIEKLQGDNTNIKKEIYTKKSVAVYCVLIAGMLLFNVLYLQSSVTSNSFMDLVNSNTDFSLKTVQYLKENNINSGILNGYTSGGWLIWNDVKQFVDSRQQPFTEEIQGNTSLDELIHAVRGSQVQRDIQSLCDKYNIDYILWNTGEMGYDVQSDLVNSGEWEIVLQDECSNQSTEYILKRIV